MVSFTKEKLNRDWIISSHSTAKLAGVIVIFGILMLSAVPFNQAFASHSFGAPLNLSNPSNADDSKTPQVSVSGSDVYVLWQEGSDVFFSSSSDTGASFGAAIDLSSTGSASLPQIAIDGDNVYAVWLDGVEVFFIKSSDKGATFPGPIIDLSGMAGTFAFGSPQIVASGNNVHTVWTDFPGGGTQIFFINSTDNGDSFPDAPLNLSPTAPSAQEVQISKSGNNVYVVWRDNNDIFFINSTDNGDTFLDPAENLSNSGSAPQSRIPQIAASGNDVYIVWREGTDIFFTRSSDKGDTFSAPVDIGDTGGAGTSAAPQVFSLGTNVYVVWRDDTSGTDDIKFRASADSGANFDVEKNLSGNAGESTSPQISAAGSNVYVVWSDDTSGNFEILASVSHDNGNTFSQSQVSTNTGSTPALASDGNNVFVAWDDDTDGDTLFSVGAPSAITIAFDQATQYRIGDTATISVTDSSSNTDDAVIENIIANVVSTTDPVGITLTLTETGPATGEFSNSVVFSATTSLDETSIEVAAGDSVTSSFGGENDIASIFPISIDIQLNMGSFVTYDYGDIVNIVVEDQNANLDAGVAETLTVTVTSNVDPIGIPLDLIETGINTGMFGGPTSKLIFMEGNDLFTKPGTVTISHENDPANVDPGVVDTTTVDVTSTTDPVGITLTVTETGVDTNIFTGKLSLTSGISAGSSIQVVGGDILTTTPTLGGGTNALIIPNHNPSVGAIQVDFVTDDTLTVSHKGVEYQVTITETGGGGGGGGGVIRPGLVFNIVAGAGLFGGGGSSGPAAPTVSSSTLTFETTASFTQLEEGTEFGGIINQKDLDKSDTQPIHVGEEIEFSFDLYENGGRGNLEHVALYLNLKGEKFTTADSDTYIIYDTGKPLEIVDKNGYFSKAEFTILEKDTFNLILKYKLVFAKAMEKSHLHLRVWDNDKRNMDLTHRDAIEIVNGEREITSFDETDLFKDETSLPSEQNLEELDSLDEARDVLQNGEHVPAWVKTSAGWWSEKRISNSEFVMGIEFLIQEKVIQVPSVETTKTTQKIPEWISTIAGSWSDEIITDAEFIAALEWLIENGVVKV